MNSLRIPIPSSASARRLDGLAASCRSRMPERRGRIAHSTSLLGMHAFHVVITLCAAALSGGALGRRTDGPTHEVYAWGRNNAGQVAAPSPLQEIWAQLTAGIADAIPFVAGTDLLSITANLGLVNYQEHAKPTPVSLLKGKHVERIAAGGSDTVDGHSLALVMPGRLFAAGDNTYGENELGLHYWYGQLGSGDHTDRDSFVPVAALYHLEVVHAAAGEMHSLALTASGEVYAWGSNSHGQLGLNDPRTEVHIDLFSTERVAGICAGYQHSAAWTSSGTVWVWGDNTYAQLGVGDKKPRRAPTKLVVKEDIQASHITCGAYHTMLITSTGFLLAWGHNKAGQLGLGVSTGKDIMQPERVPPFSKDKINEVSCGASHCLALTEKGILWGFGDNSLGQLGLRNTPKSKQPPQEISTPHGSHWLGVVAGRAHSLAMTADGKVFSWGQALLGQLGLGDSTQRSQPTEVKPLSTLKIMSLAAGGATSFAVTGSGEVWGWGKNNVGQMGLRASKAPKMLPEVVLQNQEVSRIRQVAAGGYAYMYEGHSAVLSMTGELVVWGWNSFGQLGIGEISAGTPIPQRNVWLQKQHVRQVAAGQFATAAVTDAGEVFSWGLNEAGQLGKGDFSSSAVEVPQRIHIDAHIVSVSVGYAHMLALSDEGRVYAWGRNFYGQLGVGDHKDKPSPQLISYLQEEQVVDVQAGQYHSLAITARGDVFAWGYNREYELGVGDNMDRVLPQAIPSLQGKQVKSVAACGYHSMAVSADGSLYSWGLNNYGQLGQSGRREQAMGKAPQLVQLGHGEGSGKQPKVKAVSCGSWHSVAVTDKGDLYSWGRCNMGQLGHSTKCGKNGYVSTPEKVRDLANLEVELVACGACHTLAVVSTE